MNTTMKTCASGGQRKHHAMTLVEVMVALGVGSIVMAIIMVLTVFAARSFGALGNYQVLDQASSLAADKISKEIREATKVVSFVNTGDDRNVVLLNTNALPAYSVRYEWSAASRDLTMQRSFDAAPTVLLTGCDRWDFAFYQRTPLAGPAYGFSEDMVNQDECKLVTMTWKCSRPLIGTKLLNTESVQTAQIVLRNQRTP